MSHEIYYTSAPEGMKRGTSGFCTVAASENIPRALLDRLESLSAYRHHFPAAVNSQNPVSFAHHLLNIGGTKYHVLSRICDSGVDHTQRTNAFAHHLVVENNEMAPAGPAWMLAQSGIMRSGWDGQVGALRPRTLPQGDRPAAICRRWADATGDAGWGGQLADIFIKTPAKPVCLLFGPGQDILSLMAETIALLPPMVRWNATFNTYFTSMPTSATCVWRCCLAGTPAAQLGLRYAAAGLVIDLTDQSRLGAPANGPYVTMARTGQPPAGVARTAPAPARSAPSVPPKSEPAVPRAPVTPFPVPPLSPPPEEDYSPDLDAESEDEADLPMPAAFTAPPAPATFPISAAPIPRISLPRRLTPIMRDADAALEKAERQAALAATRRRRQVLILFFGGLIVMGLAMALLFALKGNLAPEPLPSPTPSRQPSTEAPQNPAAEIPPAPAPIIPAAPVAPAPPPPEIVKIPTPTPPVIPIPSVHPAPPAPVIPAHQFPAIITCTTTMTTPKAGGGIGDSVQSVSFPGDDFQPFDAAGSSLILRFANGRGTYSFQKSANALMAGPIRGGARIFRGSIEICRINIDQQQNTVELHWKAPALLRYPEVVNIAFWALQYSTLDIFDRNPQHIAFKPIEFGPFSLAKSDATLTLPMPLPKEAAAQIPTALPKGWKASTYTDWEAKDAALRKPEDAFQVIKLEKPTAVDGISTSFLITLHPGFEKVENTFTKRAAAAATDLTSAETDLRAITATIDGFLKEGVKENDPSLQPYLQKKDDISHKVDAYKQALAGYKEITNLDVAIGMPDGLHLTTLHFQRGDK